MILPIRNTNGFICAYIEWTIVNKQGLDDDNGDYLFIKNLWIHNSYRQMLLEMIIKKLFKIIKHKKCKYVYWERRKYKRVSKLYPIERLVKIGEHYGWNEITDSRAICASASSA